MVTTLYDKLDILGDSSTACEEIFCNVMASAFFSTGHVARGPAYYIWFVN